MLVSTEGIVLNSIKYGENSQISKVYTKKHGLVSIITSSGNKTNQKSRIYFQALSNIKLIYYYKNEKSLHRLKEVGYYDRQQQSTNEIAANAIKFFLAEFLTIIIKEEEESPILYQFLANKLALLNSNNANYARFHIDFLMDFALYMGIQPNFNTSGLYFDLKEGQMVNIKPTHNEFLDKEESKMIKAYLDNQKQSKQERNIVLNSLISYYQVQIGGLHKLKSREILEVVLS